MSSADLHQLPAALEGYTIRPLRSEDALALEWEGEFTHFRRVYARAFERARAGRAVLWGLEEARGELVGQLFVLLHNEKDPEMADGRLAAFIHSFRIRPQHRNRGLGSRLLSFAEADLLGRGYSFVSLNVAQDNPSAMRLYQRLGYEKMHAITGYWSFQDHEGVLRQLHEPGWRMGKELK